MIIKVCGMREADNIRAVEQAGADWMGFIFHPGSPRHVERRPGYLPINCRRVGVFVNAPTATILPRAAAFSLDLIQLHGHETPAQCRDLKTEGYGIIKAFPIASEADLEVTAAYEDCCDYFLFDTATPNFGGSGKTFDWNILQACRGSTPFLLSGGLGPDSIPALAEFHHPKWAGIDLNSGFETAPAIKDAARLKEFIEKIRII